MAATAGPAFPEDIERAISEVLLEDTREMCSTMSLVASRFHTWTKPVRFRTVVVHRHENWMKRVENLFFPNTHYIRVLAVNLPLSGGALSVEEFSCMRTLLEASQGVRHLAIVWHLWTPFARLCGSRPLESLYFIWDRSWSYRNPVLPPSLEHLQYPSALTDLTIYAPADLYNPTPFRSLGEIFLPATAHCENLAYVAYVAECTPIPTVAALCEDSRIKAVMFVLVDIPEEYVSDGWENKNGLIRDEMEMYGNFSTAYIPLSSQVLEEWVAKVQGMRSILEHPSPHAVLRSPDDWRRCANIVAFRESEPYVRDPHFG